MHRLTAKLFVWFWVIFAISLASPKRVLIRAIGPSLSQFGLTGVMSDPLLQLFSGQTKIAENNHWYSGGNGDAIASVAKAVGAFPLDQASKDSALLATLQPGAYSAQVSSADGVPSLAMVEVYDSDDASANASMLSDLSSRASVGIGGTILIGGVSIKGDTPKAILLRAVGPSLSQFGISGTLTDPYLRIYDSNGTVVAENDNWSDQMNADQIASQTLQLGAFPLPAGSKDAALLIALPPGSYSLQVSGVSSGQGVALVEAYDTGAVAVSGSSGGGSAATYDVSRFLSQATFGPTSALIDQVSASGYSAWLDQQFATPPTLFMPFINTVTDRYPDYQDVEEAWVRAAVAGPDQLRQRVANALLEIMVVSDNNAYSDGGYMDVLLNDAFVNFRQLLQDITLNPAMGNFLTFEQNDMPNPAINRHPDENYAREVMQLFTIGLDQLNLDGTPKLDAQGHKIPTYDQSAVTGMAEVLTGWSYYKASGLDFFSPPEYLHPMRRTFRVSQRPLMTMGAACVVT